MSAASLPAQIRALDKARETYTSFCTFLWTFSFKRPLHLSCRITPPDSSREKKKKMFLDAAYIVLSLFILDYSYQIDMIEATSSTCEAVCIHYGSPYWQVDCEDQHLEAVPTDCPRETTFLSVGNNSISRIQPGTFTTYPNLERLDISYNSIINVRKMQQL